jgi:hypothetical protein
MTGQLQRGWSMARASFSVLKRNPRLVVLPAISGAIFLIVAGAILASLIATQPIWNRLGDSNSGTLWFYVAAFAVIYVLTAVAIFFNVALIHCALRCHVGDEPSIGGGLAAAAGLLPQILGWALITATIGIALNSLRYFLKENLGIFGSLLGGVFELSWAAAAYFVVPVLVTERVGPITALRRSAAILRAKWGESVAGEARFGLLGALFCLVAMAIVFGGLAIVLAYDARGLAKLGLVLMTFGVFVGIASLVALQTLSTIFQSGVYLYATTRQVPATLNADLVQGAFRRKGSGAAAQD